MPILLTHSHTPFLQYTELSHFSFLGSHHTFLTLLPLCWWPFHRYFLHLSILHTHCSYHYHLRDSLLHCLSLTHDFSICTHIAFLRLTSAFSLGAHSHVTSLSLPLTCFVLPPHTTLPHLKPAHGGPHTAHTHLQCHGGDQVSHTPGHCAWCLSDFSLTSMNQHYLFLVTDPHTGHMGSVSLTFPSPHTTHLDIDMLGAISLLTVLSLHSLCRLCCR